MKGTCMQWWGLLSFTTSWLVPWLLTGLLWCDFVEDAYERWAICFSFSPYPGHLVLHVVNKTWLDTKLIAKAECKQDVYRQFLGERTFR